MHLLAWINYIKDINNIENNIVDHSVSICALYTHNDKLFIENLLETIKITAIQEYKTTK